MKLADNLKRIRKDNNLSQEQLAEKLNVSRQAVSKWESGQSYPEMDKVLLICKLFNYNIDELMNENIKEIEETKKSKININKWIQDFFEFITKVVEMFSTMKVKERIKCILEQGIIALLLLIIFAVINAILSGLFSNLIGIVSSGTYWKVKNIFDLIYAILAFSMGFVIFLHIFKIRYLDYYEIVRDHEVNNEKIGGNLKVIEERKEELEQNSKKQIKREKIIIRDPDHSQSRFLNEIMKGILLSIKIIVGFFGIYFAFLFIGEIVCLILSFLFVKTGLVFIGTLLCVISVTSINFMILYLIYNFIKSKKSKTGKIGDIVFICALILIGIGIGLICIGITKFDYVKAIDIDSDTVVDEYIIPKNVEFFTIGRNWNGNVEVEYIETDSEEIKISVKHSKYSKTRMNYNNSKDGVIISCYQDETKSFEFIRGLITDINNKKIKNYDGYKMYIYTSKENIERLRK